MPLPLSPLVALVNHDQPIVALVQRVLTEGGFRTEPYRITHPNSRPVADDLIAFLDATWPQVTVYDIEPPYAAGWALFAAVRAATPWCPFVLTTTDPATGVTPPPEALILLRKPYGTRQLLDAVHQALATGGAAPTRAG